MLRSLVCHTAFVLFLIAPVDFVGYADAAQDPKAFAEEMSQNVLSDLTSKDLSDAERVNRLRSLIKKSFDEKEVGKYVLGVHYRRASEEQFQQFLKLYEIYVAHNYAGLFKKYSGEKVVFERSQPAEGNRILVSGRIVRASGQPITLEMRMHPAGDSYKLLDIKIEGVSMPLTHRKQFSSVISKRGKGVEGLNEALSEAVKRFESQTPSE